MVLDYNTSQKFQFSGPQQQDTRLQKFNQMLQFIFRFKKKDDLSKRTYFLVESANILYHYIIKYIIL